MTAKRWGARWIDSQMVLTWSIYQPDGDRQGLIIKAMSPKLLRILCFLHSKLKSSAPNSTGDGGCFPTPPSNSPDTSREFYSSTQF